MSDSRNDKFIIKNVEEYPNTELLIYNRWGNKIYESSNYQNDWDGENHSDGVYYYVTNNNHKEYGFSFHGFFYINR